MPLPRRALFSAAAAALLALCASCRPTPAPGGPTELNVAPGIRFVRTGGGYHLLDVDLREAKVRPAVVAEKVERIRNNFVGESKTVLAWAEQHRAIAGINAGFFGDTYDDEGRRKQIVQLAVVNGKVVAPGSDIASTRNPGERYLRSAAGFRKDGLPQIAWATGTVKNVIKRYDEPVNPSRGGAWEVESAVACGPRLFEEGRRRITDREERLVSRDKLVRVFIAYDVDEDGRPRHLILGRADAAEYGDVADFLESYFRETHGARVYDAMCFDGGSSGQVVYRDPSDGTLVDATPTGVRVPTAVLLIPEDAPGPSTVTQR